MNKKNNQYGKLTFPVLLLLMVCFSSCVSNKNITYFKDIQSLNQAKLENAAAFTEPIIQTDDILSLNIFTLDQKTGSVLNQAATTPALGGSTNSSLSTQNTGFLVDKNGDIEIALVGKVKVAGLTTYEARELIRGKVKGVGFIDPNVQLRLANFKVSVMGEVNAPSTYTLPNEKVSILDALSLAGDLTIYGKRDNILIVRDNNGKKEFARLNLNSSEIFNSPFYYLKQNDLVYVEPNKAKASANNAGQIQTISIVTSVLSVLILAITSFR
ncbi:polysaccharide biosynthesis/export family protein [Pedobacter metabolipauper]|uniref:Polysaccharide export outer membrane protein n=1 Tax=Pedobacter metabolipauper TaxID=425513 RepID=A0A4R6SWY1_9SPHI|nr:polysaccharide biosynthesis/export family protein [Pedobacter metabolipauper]TDQ09951.1 polysaccharide export outer membrane protein [Pedobacter metabolipauper]